MTRQSPDRIDRVISLRIGLGLYEELYEIARREDRTVAATIRRAVQAYLEAEAASLVGLTPELTAIRRAERKGER